MVLGVGWRLWVVLERTVKLLWLLIVVRLKHPEKWKKRQRSKQTPLLSLLSWNTFSLVVSRLLSRLSNPNLWKKITAAAIATMSYVYMGRFLSSIESIRWRPFRQKAWSIQKEITSITGNHKVLFVRFTYLIAGYRVISSIITDPVCLSFLRVCLLAEDWIA